MALPAFDFAALAAGATRLVAVHLAFDFRGAATLFFAIENSSGISEGRWAAGFVGALLRRRRGLVNCDFIGGTALFHCRRRRILL